LLLSFLPVKAGIAVQRKSGVEYRQLIQFELIEGLPETRQVSNRQMQVQLLAGLLNRAVVQRDVTGIRQQAEFTGTRIEQAGSCLGVPGGIGEGRAEFPEAREQTREALLACIFKRFLVHQDQSEHVIQVAQMIELDRGDIKQAREAEDTRLAQAG